MERDKKGSQMYMMLFVSFTHACSWPRTYVPGKNLEPMLDITTRGDALVGRYWERVTQCLGPEWDGMEGLESLLKPRKNNPLGSGGNATTTRAVKSRDENYFFVEGAAGKTKPAMQKSIAFRSLSPPNTR